MNKRFLQLSLVYLIINLHKPLLLAVEPILLHTSRNQYSLKNHFEVLEDPKRQWTLEKIQKLKSPGFFKALPDQFPNYGFSDTRIWLRFKLNNSQGGNVRWIFDLGYPFQGIVNFFIPGHSGYGKKKVTGSNFNFSSREIFYRNYAYFLPAKIDPENYFYLQVENSGAPLIVPMHIWSQNGFIEYVQKEQLYHGFYIGIFFLLIFYSLIIFFQFREKSFIYFSLFSFFYLFSQITLNGLSFQYLWQDELHYWKKICIPLFTYATYLFFLLFAKNFLKISAYSRRFRNLVNGLIALNSLFIVMTFYLPLLSLANIITGIMLILLTLLLVPMGFIIWRKGFEPAKYFSIAFLTLFVTGNLYGLLINGIVDYTIVHELGLQTGSILSVSILSFGLAKKVKIINEQKEKAQDETIRIEKEAKENLEKKVEERTRELGKANEKLKELDKVKSEFFANISHEFRTPLTLILSPLESILQGKFGDAISKKDYIFETMLHNGNRLIKLINNLLDFARLEAGKTIVKKQNMDIPALLEFYISSVDSQAKIKGLNLNYQNNNHGLVANIDKDLFETAFFNLVSNAFKFTPKGGSINVILDEGQDDTFTVTIMDTGIGIPLDKQDYIFERFGQLDTSASRKFEGTGIGLALTKEIMELSGGRLSVKSEPGKGSAFTVTLPVGDIYAGEKKEPFGEVKPYLLTEFRAGAKAGLGSKGGPLAKSKGKTILIVEDSADMSSYLAGLLIENYNIITAQNGKQGIEKALLEKPDLILSDIMMPEMDGYEMTKRIGKEDKLRGIPVILLTAKADTEMKIEGIELGAVDYVTKPFNPRELVARIGSQLELKKLRDELKSANQHLQRAMNDSSILVSDVGHRFYNELWSVSQLSNVVREMLLELAGIEQAIDKDIIDYAKSTLEKSEKSLEKIEAMKQKIKDNFGKVVETEDIDICQIAAEVAEEFEDSCRERGILFDRKNITAEKALIHGNAEQVRIVFNNLLNNAVQALSVLERDKKRISLSVLPSGSGVEIIIEDNGSGIPDNIRGNIFKMFFSTKEGRGEGGLGMGLAIARWVVEDCHKGRIRVESKVGEFTRFVIRLPVA